MNRWLFSSLMVLGFCAMLPAHSSAQIRVMPGGKKIVLGKDTLCYRYRFVAGDTLYYAIESKDSIDIDTRGILAKVRSERLKIICDSASNGIYHLRLITIRASEYQATETDTVFRPGHPWVGREVRLVIDSLGRRLAESTSSDLAMLCPGGAYQPLRLPVLDSSCGRQNQSWLSEDTVRYAENAVPYPVMNQQVLWRVGDKLDTLGRQCQWIIYSLTGSGMMDMAASQLSMQSSSAIAESGRLVFDNTLAVPLVATIQHDNRFTILSTSGGKTTGKHLMVVVMELEEVVSSDPQRRFQRRSETPRKTSRRRK
ncbi:MAG: hypothetical protein ACK45E_08285 [Ignavibacteria bacterium]|jgi:hypothetical protein